MTEIAPRITVDERVRFGRPVIRGTRVRFPNDMPAARLTQTILEALRNLTDADIDGNLLIIEPERVRLRRKA
ncbi:MAG: DUF433 domain-containing protein [Candidatus Rokubacteria bacterium]|nr:DUF433 domain-containing protein [Candidatus Rokubacteria bacterium]